MKFDTIREAAQDWVREFDAIPQGMIQKIMEADEDALYEITPPAKYDRVYHFDTGEYGEITDIDGDGLLTIELDNGSTVKGVEPEDVEVQYDGYFPIWGTMWMFHEVLDDDWAREHGGLQAMADCGFRIYDSEWGYIFGIDGAGYDFYESHWIPLYKARGLQWHKNINEIPAVLDYVLEDNNSDYGGTAFHGETVRDFLEEHDGIEAIDELNEALRRCGIFPIMYSVLR